MKTTFLLIASLIAAVPAHAQDTLKTTNIQRYYNPVKFDLLGAASVMPADKYGFKLDPAQMDFGQWINHSTERNYLDCSTLRGELNPMPKAKTDLLKTKAEIAKALAESFDYCDATFEKLNDAKNRSQGTSPSGGVKLTSASYPGKSLTRLKSKSALPIALGHIAHPSVLAGISVTAKLPGCEYVSTIAAPS